MLRFFVLASLIALAKANCDSLIYREGVRVHCEDTGTKKSLECHAGQLPTGSIATYNCANKYYLPLNDFQEGQLICDSRGQWTGHAEFLAFSCTINCGVPQMGNFVGFVVGGTETEKGHWPWHASIFTRQNLTDEFKYTCGGTLIKPYSKGFIVLTAAHCLVDEDESAREDFENMKIVLGGEFSSLDENEKVKDVQIHTVRRIIFHKSYKGISNNFQGDIAIIGLKEIIELSSNVIPACFSRGVELTDDNAIGEVVGFGAFSEQDPEAVSLTLRNVTLPVVDSNLCFQWRQSELTSQEFCAGFENSQATCNGDSGGGFLVKAVSNGLKRQYIQGIVSHGKRDLKNQTETCDSFSVFTKVNSYAKWIRDSAEELFPEDDSKLPKLIQLPSQSTSATLHSEGMTTFDLITTTQVPNLERLVINFEPTQPPLSIPQSTTTPGNLVNTQPVTSFPESTTKFSTPFPETTPFNVLPEITTFHGPLPEMPTFQGPLPDLTTSQTPLPELTTPQAALPELTTSQAPLPELTTSQAPLPTPLPEMTTFQAPVSEISKSASLETLTLPPFDLSKPELTTLGDKPEIATTSPPTITTQAQIPDIVVSKEASTSVELLTFRTSQPNRRQNPLTVTTPLSSGSVQQYDLNALERHNYYRSMHDAKPLRLSSQMKQRAQAYAEKLIRDGTFENVNEKGINKNVYYVTGSRVKADGAVISAVNAWYADINSYNWDNPYYSTFSQVVWKETTEMGTGVASDGRRTIVVVAYSPPGNILGENGKYFKENVSPKTQE